MIDLTTFTTITGTTFEECVKVLYTRFRGNWPQYNTKFLEPLNAYLTMHEIQCRDSIVHIYAELFKKSTSYTYTEAFNVENADLRSAVFDAINVEEMMKELGSTRISVKGIDLINREFIPQLNKFKDTEFTQIYELHKINTAKLNLFEPAYALKCWCATTDKEHWLWISDEFKSDILAAVASTCMIYPSMRNKIKHILRQGDIFIFEMTEEVIPSSDEVLEHMTPNDYFSLLKSQS